MSKGSKNVFLEALEKDYQFDPEEDIEKYLTNRYDVAKIPTSEIDVLIIGSGVSGLASGVFCAKENKKVVILEQFHRAGGSLISFFDKGYEFEVGINYIEDCSVGTVNNLLFQYVSEKQVQFSNYGELLDTIHVGDKTYQFSVGDNFSESLKKEFPKESDNIDRFFDLARKIAGEEWGIVALQKYNNVSVDALLHEFFKDDELIRLLAYFSSLLGTYETVPASIYLFVLYSYMKKGAYFPSTGSGDISKAMGRVLKKYGAVILTNAKVQKILADSKKVAIGVELENGDVIKAKHVISCCGVQNTYDMLGKKYEPALLKDLPISKHQFFIFMGFDCEWEELGLPPSNVYLLNDVRKSAEFCKQSLEELLKGDFQPPLIFIGNHNHVYTSEKGKATCIVDFECNGAWFEKWKSLRCRNRGNDYQEVKDAITDKVLEIIYKKYPKMKDHLEVCFSATPLTVKHFLNYKTGETFGMQNNSDRHLKYYDEFVKKVPVKNLSLAGQDAFFSHGITPAIYSSIFACEKILKKPLFDQCEKAVKLMKKNKEQNNK